MKLVKRLSLIGLACLLSFGMVACNKSTDHLETNTSQTVIDETNTSEEDEVAVDPSQLMVAKVGDAGISKEIFDEEYEYYHSLFTYQLGEDFVNSEDGQSMLEQLKTDILNNLVCMEMAMQKADSYGVKIDEAEVEKVFEEEKATFETEEDFASALEASNLTEESFRNEIFKTLTFEKLVELLQSDIVVTEEEAKTYYDENTSLYKISAGANMKHILALDSKEDAEAIVKELKSGKSFDEVFEVYANLTDDPASFVAEDLGFVQYDEDFMDPLFLDGAKNLKEGEYSDPVESTFGWHIIYATNLQEEKTQTFDEVKQDIIDELTAEKGSDELEKIFSEWKTELGVQIIEENLN